MSNYHICFSPTGGTRAVADQLIRGLGGEFTLVDLMQHPEPLHLHDCDLCVISVPSYGGRVPAVAVEQLRQFIGSGAQAILVAVFGNRAIDDTLLELFDEAKASGFRPVSAVEAVAQHSLLPRFGAGRPDDRDDAELLEFGVKIRAALDSGSPSGELKLPGSRPYREYKGVPLKPSVSDGCIGCGICAAECPVGAIPELNYRMTDSRKCISCMHCVAVCPQHVRKVSRLMTFVAGQKMKKTCSDRKPNKLYL